MASKRRRNVSNTKFNKTYNLYQNLIVFVLDLVCDDAQQVNK